MRVRACVRACVNVFVCWVRVRFRVSRFRVRVRVETKNLNAAEFTHPG